MNRIAPVRTAAQHARAVQRIAELFDAAAGSEEADELDILVALVDAYERSCMPRPPSAVAAIRFRMGQEGLGPRDLEPYIGSRARVSEILSGERTLSIEMMRALRRHLGIPADSLLGCDPAPVLEGMDEPSPGTLGKLSETGLLGVGESFRAFLARGFGEAVRPAMLRKMRTDRANAKSDATALQGWCAATLLKSRNVQVTRSPSALPDAHMAREIAQLSADAQGISKVRGFLAERGIAMVVLTHLPGTFLDGAAMLRDDGVPVIALTLRRDRTDNFWFTLLHEFAHVACHLGEGISMILDDLDIRSAETVEAEADQFAERALIPDALAAELRVAEFELPDVQRLARRAGVNEAIVAGRWQREHRDYRKFSKLVGHGTVRRQLASV